MQQFKIKAIQYIRARNVAGWKAVDSITLTLRLDVTGLSQKAIKLRVRRDVKQYLGRNCAVIDIHAMA